MSGRQQHLEAGLEDWFRARVRERGGLVVKLIPTFKGMPDRLVLWPDGRTFLVELKTETGVLSPIQRHVHAKLHDLGHPVYVLAGRAQVLTWLRARAQDSPRSGTKRANGRGACPACGKDCALRNDGTVRAHDCTPQED